MSKQSDLTKLAATLGVGVPVVPVLWQMALTHRSMAGAVESYERLEFLGDRVLGFAMAAWLLELFPADEEGGLARRLAALVREDTLAMVAKGWGLAPFVTVGASVRGEGGVKDSVLADCVEALLAVIWREQGMAAVEALVRRAWTPYVHTLGDKDPKTALQEIVQAEGEALPRYEVVGEEGPEHAKRFVVRVRAGGRDAVGQGASKKEAEMVAAAKLVERLKG